MQHGLVAIHNKSTNNFGGRLNPPDWIPEDVYASLRAGNAQLLISQCDAQIIGFVIYYINQTPFTNRKELFVWHAWTLPLAQRHGLDVDGAVAATWAYIEQVAKAQGCYKLRNLSTRKAFGKWAAKFGLEWEHSSYVKLI